MVFRKFQVREWKGLYSVVFNHDLSNGETRVYESTKWIDLPYDEVVKLARQCEVDFREGRLKVDVTNEDEWLFIY